MGQEITFRASRSLHLPHRITLAGREWPQTADGDIYGLLVVAAEEPLTGHVANGSFLPHGAIHGVIVTAAVMKRSVTALTSKFRSASTGDEVWVPDAKRFIRLHPTRTRHILFSTNEVLISMQAETAMRDIDDIPILGSIKRFTQYEESPLETWAVFFVIFAIFLSQAIHDNLRQGIHTLSFVTIFGAFF